MPLRFPIRQYFLKSAECFYLVFSCLLFSRLLILKFHFVFFRKVYISNSLINNVVSKSHELVKANYAMTVNEQRLILSAICQINSLAELLDPSAKFIVTVPQFQEIFCTDSNKKNVYRDLKEAAEAH